jgi:hypothetical protein
MFTRNLSLRPNVEFAFGEVTRLFAVNPEALYRLPFSPAGGRWSAYLGGGPSFAFVDQSFERAAQGDRDINFNDFDFKAGLILSLVSSSEVACFSRQRQPFTLNRIFGLLWGITSNNDWPTTHSGRVPRRR